LRFVVFLVRIWRSPCFLNLTLPVPVTLYRFAAAFLVFILGMFYLVISALGNKNPQKLPFQSPYGDYLLCCCCCFLTALLAGLRSMDMFLPSMTGCESTLYNISFSVKSSSIL